MVTFPRLVIVVFFYTKRTNTVQEFAEYIVITQNGKEDLASDQQLVP